MNSRRLHAANAGRHSLADRGDDLYETPPCAVRALLPVDRCPRSSGSRPAAPAASSRELRAAGHHVYATDLVDYGCPDSESGLDFLMALEPAFCVGAIITNPPYKLAAEFVTRALMLCPRVIMLMRLAFLESERRRPILDGGFLARVYVFRNRLPMMHRDGWDGPRSTSSMPFAWFVWDRAHRGPTELQRISWESPQ